MPLTVWVVEVGSVIGAALVLTAAVLVLLEIGTPAMTAVARPSAVMTTS